MFSAYSRVSSPRWVESFVAMVHFSRGWRLSAMPVTRSDSPCPYMGAVSKYVMPCSMAWSTRALTCSWSMTVLPSALVVVGQRMQP